MAKKRCRKYGWRKDRKGCLRYPRRSSSKKGSSSRDPKGSPLYKDAMTYIRGTIRAGACGSPERNRRISHVVNYLKRLNGIEAQHGLDAPKAAARSKHIIRTLAAAQKIFVKGCNPKRGREQYGPVYDPRQAGVP